MRPFTNRLVFGAFSVDEHSSAPTPVADDEDKIPDHREIIEPDAFPVEIGKVAERDAVVMRNKSVGSDEKNVISNR